MKRPIDFAGIARTALAHAPTLVTRWLPQGRRFGNEWIARNPMRNDRRAGSFRINLETGRWADFATPDRGSDLISLAAYLHCNNDQGEAARLLAQALSVDLYDD